VKAASGSVAAKAESGAASNVFGGTNPTLGTVPLSAFMAGVSYPLSFEIYGDVPALMTFLFQDGMLDLDTYEENLFVNGSGVGMAQGLIGNVGAGVSESVDAAGNLVNPDGILDLIDSVKAKYLNGSSFLMQRATATIIRKAQRQANLYEGVWTRENGQDYLHGYPVAYSAAMPAAAHGACPVLFGNFKLGYIVGDRGGVNLKVLDQVNAALGEVQVFIYRRSDGRVRNADCIQGYNVI
jgi:HK97 family phage major capsid protein